MAETHRIMGGKVNVYRRENSQYWQCSTFINGRNWRVSTREDSLSHAKDFAEDWYLELKGKSRAGILKAGRKFKEAARKFLEEYPVITQGDRSEQWIKQKELKLQSIVLPFLGNNFLSEVTAGKVQDYRVHRAKTCITGRPPARSTIHQEIVLIRQVLKTAQRHGWIEHLPDLSVPYRTSGKIK